MADNLDLKPVGAAAGADIDNIEKSAETHIEDGAHPSGSDADAILAERAEHDMSLGQSLVTHRKAILWSMAISLVIVMDGYDTGRKLAMKAPAENSPLKHQRASHLPPTVRGALGEGVPAHRRLADSSHRGTHRRQHHVGHDRVLVLWATRSYQRYICQFDISRPPRIQAHHSDLPGGSDRIHLQRAYCRGSLRRSCESESGEVVCRAECSFSVVSPGAHFRV